MSGFVVTDRSSGVYYAPDSSIRHEKWWNDPTPPKRLPSISSVDTLLNQANEEGSTGKKSCFLTAQLNALIIRGSLDPSSAAEVQSQLVNEERFSSYWLSYNSAGDLGWTDSPLNLAFILEDFFGTRIGVERVEGDDITTAANDRLKSGYAVVLLGESVLGGHARLAFETAENTGAVFVHDPNPRYIDKTGIYAYKDIASLQTQDHIVVF